MAIRNQRRESGAMAATLLLSLTLAVGGCTSTDPPPGEPPPSRIAFGSCADQHQPQPIWNAVVASEPELFILLGDNVYADTTDMQKMRRDYELFDANTDFQALRQTTPVLGTWDDHDYGVNDGGAEFSARRESQREFLRFFEVPESSPRWQRDGVYHSRSYGPEGQRLQIILLDTRFFRGPLTPIPEGVEAPGRYVPTADTAATMLGGEQWAWLEERLREPAEIRLLISSIQLVAEENGWEIWHNFPHERERLLRLIRDTGAGGVIVLSGDRHLAEISRLGADEGPGYSLYDVTSSSLNRPGGGSDDESNRHRIGGGNYRDINFGLIEIDWLEDDPAIRLEIRDLEGTPVLTHTLRLSELSALRQSNGGDEA